MNPIQTPKLISDRARLVLQHFGAESLNELEPDLREYHDGAVRIFAASLDSLLIQVIHETDIITVLNIDADSDVLIYRPDLILPDGTDWRDRLTELEATVPADANAQLFDKLRAIAGTPDADVIQHLIDLSNLERMGVAAASWVLCLLKKMATLGENLEPAT